MRTRLAFYATALLTLAFGLADAAEPAEFHIGVVASATGPYAAPTKDTFDGFNAWLKQRGLPDKKIVLQTLDDETNPVNAANAFRKLASDSSIACDQWPGNVRHAGSHGAGRALHNIGEIAERQAGAG